MWGPIDRSLLLLLLLVACTSIRSSSNSASEWRLISEATTINHFVDVGMTGPSPGDTYTFSDKLLDPNDGEKQVGTADGHCTLIDPATQRFTCTITCSFSSGAISTESILIFRPGETSFGAITGGTGNYADARGDAVLTLGPIVGKPAARHTVVFRLRRDPGGAT